MANIITISKLLGTGIPIEFLCSTFNNWNIRPTNRIVILEDGDKIVNPKEHNLDGLIILQEDIAKLITNARLILEYKTVKRMMDEAGIDYSKE